MISNYISLPIFLISFAIGLFFVYIIGPETKTIFVYPSPQNYMKTQYKDITDQCFQINLNKTECPLNPLLVKSVPIQK